jgi:hypothetical protein
MLEIFIERWSSFDGGVRYPWSVWDGGKRVEMGGPFDTAEEAEAEARAWCEAELKRTADRVRRL